MSTDVAMKLNHLNLLPLESLALYRSGRHHSKSNHLSTVKRRPVAAPHWHDG
jgi:hypothetical protein